MWNVCREEGRKTPTTRPMLCVFWARGVPNRRRWYCRVGFNTKHCCIWHSLAIIKLLIINNYCGKAAVVGLKMGSLISPVVTAYRFPIGLSLTVFAVLRLVTDGRTDGIGLAKGGNFVGRQTVELCTEIDHWFMQQSIATDHAV